MKPEPASFLPAGHVYWLAALFLLALLPRLYSAQTLGWNWDSPGSFTLINFDEGGSCRAALQGFPYSTFIGHQTIAIADLLGEGPPSGVIGNARAAKAYCHSPEHILIARSYSAVTGALTVVALAVLGLLLVPSRPAIAWTAATLLALSGFHISESHSGTVDAPSVFFIYTFLAVLVYAVSRRRRGALLLSPLLMMFAVWTKYWVFAGLAYLALVPGRAWEYVVHGVSGRRLVLLVVAVALLAAMMTNSEFQRANLYPLAGLFYLAIPWRQVHRPMALFWLILPVIAYLLIQVDVIDKYTTGIESTAFGTGYAAIGWNKLLRNLVNIPAVMLVGLGLPACFFIPAGFRYITRSTHNQRAWLCLLPVPVFALYMAFVAPVTYYRHYLALLPLAALIASCGFWASGWAGKRSIMALFLVWPTLLAFDVVLDYHRDPRIALRQWYLEHDNPSVFASYYINPPAPSRGNSSLFRPEYALGDARVLKQAQFLLLSENWYDTAFANELNGPRIDTLSRLVKTTPEHAGFYRQALAGQHPNLVLESSLEVGNFMPELLLHSRFYGTFQLFVGDIRILRVVP